MRMRMLSSDVSEMVPEKEGSHDRAMSCLSHLHSFRQVAFFVRSVGCR